MIPKPRMGSVRCLSAGGFHGMAYAEWGPPAAARVAVCVHGLTRNGSDFDVLARDMASAGWRVVCPDVVGRGRSDWLADANAYGYAQYLADMTVLLGRLAVERVTWIGTSMGGLIGMMLAAQAGTPVERLVVNDIGPFIPKAALARIAAYTGMAPEFSELAAAERYLRAVYGAFGDLGDDGWRRLTETSVVPVQGGGFRLHYDPRIGDAIRQAPLEDVDLWGLWDRITVPTLALRGAASDVLPAGTALEMSRRGPRARVVEIAGCGHAPALRAADQVALIRDWLGGL
ncbi:MAG TPA: alpha/beta hydrolase [Kiloniellales bacterium]